MPQEPSRALSYFRAPGCDMIDLRRGTGVTKLQRSSTKQKDILSEVRLILDRYPRSLELRDGTKVTLRALLPSDSARLIRLFADIPHEELRNLHDDVSNPTIVRRWCRHINYDRVLPIVAEHEGRLVADATLHRRPVGPTRQIGRFRAYVRPEYRRRGLGKALLEEIADLARGVGLQQLAVELYEDQEALSDALLRSRFREVARVPVYQRVVLVRSL
jgi:GNAT superfamily N-acetyltransferase